MIHDQDLLVFLWENACNTIIYILNMCLHKILEDKTLKEEPISVKPKVTHFHIIDCPIYIHVIVNKRTKFEPQQEGFIFWL